MARLIFRDLSDCMWLTYIMPRGYQRSKVHLLQNWSEKDSPQLDSIGSVNCQLCWVLLHLTSWEIHLLLLCKIMRVLLKLSLFIITPNYVFFMWSIIMYCHLSLHHCFWNLQCSHVLVFNNCFNKFQCIQLYSCVMIQVKAVFNTLYHNVDSLIFVNFPCREKKMIERPPNS